MGVSCSRLLTIDVNRDGRPDLEQIIEEIAKRVLLSILDSSESRPEMVREEPVDDRTTNSTVKYENNEI